MNDTDKKRDNDMHDLPLVMVGGPIQNKVWSIAAYLDALFAQDYPKDRLSLVFYINDSTDGTKEILVDKLRQVKDLYHRVSVIEENWKHCDKRMDRMLEDIAMSARTSSEDLTVINFAHFARIRNEWLKLIEDEEWYFSIDSDVVLKQSFALRQLIDNNLKIVAVPVDNSANRKDGYDSRNEIIGRLLRDPNPKNRQFVREILAKRDKSKLGSVEVWNYGFIRGGQLCRFDKISGIFKVDYTGACILFSRDVVDAGVVYGSHPLGEDIYFCSVAKSLGFDIYVDGTLETWHRMDY